jgi:hypothetical protein
MIFSMASPEELPEFISIPPVVNSVPLNDFTPQRFDPSPGLRAIPVKPSANPIRDPNDSELAVIENVKTALTLLNDQSADLYKVANSFGDLINDLSETDEIEGYRRVKPFNFDLEVVKFGLGRFGGASDIVQIIELEPKPQAPISIPAFKAAFGEYRLNIRANPYEPESITFLFSPIKNQNKLYRVSINFKRDFANGQHVEDGIISSIHIYE